MAGRDTQVVWTGEGTSVQRKSAINVIQFIPHIQNRIVLKVSILKIQMKQDFYSTLVIRIMIQNPILVMCAKSIYGTNGCIKQYTHEAINHWFSNVLAL